MPSRTLIILIASIACSILLVVASPLRAQTAADADLRKLIADAVKYQSGQSVEPLQKIDQLLRDSAAKPALRADLEAAAVKFLAPGATFEARRFACQLLAVVGTDTSLPALAELLSNDETAGIACLALSGRRSPKVNQVLRNALPSARNRTRLQIISALGNHRDAESVKALAELARGGDAEASEMAIVALGKIGGGAAHDAVAALRKEARPAQVLAVTEATFRVAEQLAAAGDRKAASALYTELLRTESPINVRRGALSALLQLDEDSGRQRILDTILGRDPTLVPVAIARVASLKCVDASQTFAGILPRLSPSAQVWMVEALAARGDAGAREAICRQVDARDAGVRRAAVLAVGRLEDASAVALLAKMLASVERPEELQDVELALAGLRGGTATDKALVGELKRSSPEVKVRLISVLTRRNARVAVPALLAEAGGSDSTTARAAFLSLGKVAAEDDLPALLEKLTSLKAPTARTDAELAAARVAARMADVTRPSEIVRAALAKTSDVETRCSLLQLLSGAADARALAVVTAAVADPQPQVRDAAVRALAAWPDASGWDALLAILRRPGNDTHRALALRAMTRLAGDLNARPDAALLDRYRQLLSGARGDELKLILGALGGAAHPDALGLALPLVSRAGVRAEAQAAVKKIAESVRAEHPREAQAAMEQLKQTKP
jgi:HEAT repeat protein